MNYFGHVALACGFEQDPDFLLGSMLPDFIGIMGRGTLACRTCKLKQGVDFHVLTDEIFHSQAWFVTRVRRSLDELRRLGVRKGPARAVAHIGVELLLDFELSSQQLFRSALRDALVAAGPKRITSLLAWSDDATLAAFESLRLRLLERCERPDLFATSRIVERLTYMFRNRPRLELAGNERQLINNWINNLWVPFGDELEPLFSGMDATLRTRWLAQNSVTPPRLAAVS